MDLQSDALPPELSELSDHHTYIHTVTSKDQMEIWWDQQIRTITKIEKNKPDIIIWHSDRQLCQMTEITVPLDTNLKKAYKDKQEKYIPLITNMQRVHRDTNMKQSSSQWEQWVQYRRA